MRVYVVSLLFQKLRDFGHADAYSNDRNLSFVSIFYGEKQYFYNRNRSLTQFSHNLFEKDSQKPTKM